LLAKHTRSGVYDGREIAVFRRFALYGFLKNVRLFEPFLILALRDGGLSYTQIGLLYAIRALTTNVLEIPSGLLADLWGRRPALIVAFLGYIASFILFYVANGFAAFAIAMVCFGLGEAFRSGTHKALILSYLADRGMSDRRLEYYGATRAASQLGSALNALLAAGLVIYSGNYRFLFLASSLPYVLGLINIVTYPRSLERPSSAGSYADTIRGFAAIFRNRPALRAMTNSAVFTACFKSSKDYLQPVVAAAALTLPWGFGLDATDRTAVLMGVVYSLIFVIASGASRSARGISDRFRDAASAVNVTYIVGAGALLLAGLGSYVTAMAVSIVSFLVLYVIQNVRKPMNVAYTSGQLPEAVMASGLSAESQFKTLLEMFIAPAIGVVADRVGLGVSLMGAGAFLVVLYPLARVLPGGQEHNNTQAQSPE